MSRENPREVQLHKHREEKVLLEFCWPLPGNTHTFFSLFVSLLFFQVHFFNYVFHYFFSRYTFFTIFSRYMFFHYVFHYFFRVHFFTIFFHYFFPGTFFSLCLITMFSGYIFSHLFSLLIFFPDTLFSHCFSLFFPDTIFFRFQNSEKSVPVRGKCSFFTSFDCFPSKGTCFFLFFPFFSDFKIVKKVYPYGENVLC